jgi:hypothetical protein
MKSFDWLIREMFCRIQLEQGKSRGAGPDGSASLLLGVIANHSPVHNGAAMPPGWTARSASRGLGLSRISAFAECVARCTPFHLLYGLKSNGAPKGTLSFFKEACSSLVLGPNTL